MLAKGNSVVSGSKGRECSDCWQREGNVVSGGKEKECAQWWQRERVWLRKRADAFDVKIEAM